jgi:hypothetical protein
MRSRGFTPELPLGSTPLLPSAPIEATLKISIPVERLQMLHLAADTLGRSVDDLLREAVELCVDTTVALAVHKTGLQ